MTEEINAAGYCVGMSVAESLMQQDLNGISPTAIAEGIADVFNQKDLRMELSKLTYNALTKRNSAQSVRKVKIS